MHRSGPSAPLLERSSAGPQIMMSFGPMLGGDRRGDRRRRRAAGPQGRPRTSDDDAADLPPGLRLGLWARERSWRRPQPEAGFVVQEPDYLSRTRHGRGRIDVYAPDLPDETGRIIYL